MAAEPLGTEAHDRGLVHRDIKPANILIEKGTGRVKIADFGIARGLGATARMTAGPGVLGTPLYMRPEQAQGKPRARTSIIAPTCTLLAPRSSTF